MPRLVLVLALAVGLWASHAQAQYVRIKIDLNDYKVDTNPPQTGGMGPGGIPGFPGGSMPGFPGGGEPGFPGGGGEDPYGGSPPVGEPPSMPDGSGDPYDPMNPYGTMTPPAPKDPPVWVEVRFPISNAKVEQLPDGNKYALIKHEWGMSAIPFMAVDWIMESPVKKRWEQNKSYVAKNKSTEQGLLSLAEWALQHGMMKEFAETMEQFEKRFEKSAATAAYKSVRDKLKAAPKQDDPGAAAIVSRLTQAGYQRVESSSGHYSLYTQLSEKDRAVTSRLQHLERTYQTFYYWFALKGKTLNQPNYRLVVVLESSPRDFRASLKAYTSAPMKDAGFLSDGHNVVFLSAKPITEVYSQLEKNNNSYWKELDTNQDKLLKFDVPKQLGSSIDNVAKLHTLALAQRGLEDQTAAATTTHEAVQQILAAADILPRNVLTAEWLRYGLASYFETPRLAFYESAGLANWNNLVYFRHHVKAGTIPPKIRGIVLYRTITDQYFSQAEMALRLAENADDKSAARKDAETRLQVAHGTAWALTYYLMSTDHDKLLAYCDQLKQLPRDIEYTPPVLAGCFGRALGWPEAAAEEPVPVPLSKLDEFSKVWYDTYLLTNSVRLDVTGIQELSMKDLAEPYKKKQKPAPPKGAPGKPGTPGPGIGGFGR
jgi:hypothetical protein